MKLTESFQFESERRPKMKLKVNLILKGKYFVPGLNLFRGPLDQTVVPLISFITENGPPRDGTGYG